MKNSISNYLVCWLIFALMGFGLVVMGCTDDSKSASTWYADTDGDGYGNLNQEMIAEEQPNGYVLNYSDCDDSRDDVYPGADENYGDDIDHDCDGCPYRVCCLEGDDAISPDSITISEEDDFEDLIWAGKYYTTIDGNLTIWYTDFTDLTNIDELSCIDTVTGDLTIIANDYLCDDNAQAFADNLDTIGGTVDIRQNGDEADCN